MEKLSIVPQSQEENEKIFTKEKIEINPEELDRICSLDVDEEDKQFFQKTSNGDTVYAILHSLAGRNEKNELPISEPTFRYKRNLDECKKLKISVYKLLDKKQIHKETDANLLEDAAILLELERRKAHWLEENYYPSLYQKAIDSAKGEVCQFLIKQKNTAQLDRFADLKNITINLKDELTYLEEGNDPKSVGIYKGHKIDIRIPEYYSAQDEWKIFLVAVHELVHHASYQNYERIGIKKIYDDPNQEEINEAMTEIVSFFIAKDHLDKQKTPLAGENKNLQLVDMSYNDFTHIVKVISSKIPLSLFVDAMLNKDGLQKLSNKFDEVFDDKESLIKFAENLKWLYTPRTKKGGGIVNIADYKK